MDGGFEKKSQIANKILYSILEKSYIVWITNIISILLHFNVLFDYDDTVVFYWLKNLRI